MFRSILPEPENDDRTQVPQGMRTGVLDLTSGILSVIWRMQDNEACEATLPVFDGRRRYDLVFFHGGKHKLHANGYSPFVGHAIVCQLSVQKKAGFKQTDRSGWNDGDRRATVWMGKPFPNAPPLPIRMTLDTPFGGLVAHLSAAMCEANGQKVRLTRKTEVGNK